MGRIEGGGVAIARFHGLPEAGGVEGRGGAPVGYKELPGSSQGEGRGVAGASCHELPKIIMDEGGGGTSVRFRKPREVCWSVRLIRGASSCFDAPEINKIVGRLEVAATLCEHLSVV